MGRIIDLCGDIAAAAEEGPDGLVLPIDAWEQFRQDWNDEDIEDGLSLVNDSLMQAELVESADSLSARLVEILGTYGGPGAFRQVEAGTATISLDVLGQLARRVARLEEVLETYREGTPPDRSGFDALQTRLAKHGLSDDDDSDHDPGTLFTGRRGDEDDADDDRD